MRICPRPLDGRIVSTGSTPGSPGCQAQPVRPPSLALTQPTVAVIAATSIGLPSRCRPSASDNTESPPPLAGRGSWGRGLAAVDATDRTTQPRRRWQARTSPARRRRARSHRPARQMPGIGHMPPQCRGQRLGRTRRIAQPPARGRQPQPGLPHIVRGTDRRRTVPPRACRHGRDRRSPAPAPASGRAAPGGRRGPASGAPPAPLPGGSLRLAALERLERERRRAQPAPSVADRLCVRAAPTRPAASAARSLRASCRPCASARSSQTRARSVSRSPARPRAR